MDVTDLVKTALETGCISARLGGRLQLLQYFRPGPLLGEGSNDTRLCYAMIRSQTSRASNPRDKIFALESLLPRWAGRLIYVDYEESCEKVFKRVTARLYNGSGVFFMASLFPLLTECHGDTDGPSWVLDFTYSNPGFRQGRAAKNGTDPVTLSGFILDTVESHPVCKERLVAPGVFTTTTTIFCTGIRVDYIWKTAQIQRMNAELEILVITELARYVDTKRRSRRGLDEQHFLPDSGKIHPGLISLIFFFLLQIDGRVPGGDLAALGKHRLHAVLGKHYFITQGGIVGLAASPVKEGDCLALCYNAPLYFIMREVQEDTRSKETVQLRIVARAVVHDDELTGMTSLINNLPRERFEII